MLKTLQRRNFLIFWLAGLLSMLGDHLLGIALPYYVYEQTGSALATGATVAANHLPPILLGSVAGVFVDRWEKKWVMVVTDVLRFLILLPMLLAYSPEWLWLIYVILFAQGIVSQFFNPAKSAIIPQLVEKEYLVAANSLDSIASKFARLVGPPLGGALLSVIGLMSVILLDSISFLLSGILLGLINVISTQQDRGKDSYTQPRDIAQETIEKQPMLWQEWIAGLYLIRRETIVKSLFIIEGTGMVAEGVINVLWVAFVLDVMQASSLQFGWLSSAFALGALLGGFIIGQMSNSPSSIYWISFGRIAVGVIWLIMLNLPELWLAYTLLFLNGVVAIGYGISTQTLLQLSVTDQYRGRMFGSYNTTNSLMRLMGVGIAIALGDTLGASMILQFGACLFILAGAYAATTILRQSLPDEMIS